MSPASGDTWHRGAAERLGEQTPETTECADLEVDGWVGAGAEATQAWPGPSCPSLLVLSLYCCQPQWLLWLTFRLQHMLPYFSFNPVSVQVPLREGQTDPVIMLFCFRIFLFILCCFLLFVRLFVFAGLGSNPGCMLSKHSTSKLHPQSQLLVLSSSTSHSSLAGPWISRPWVNMYHPVSWAMRERPRQQRPLLRPKAVGRCTGSCRKAGHIRSPSPLHSCIYGCGPGFQNQHSPLSIFCFSD